MVCIGVKYIYILLGFAEELEVVCERKAKVKDGAETSG